MNKQHAPTMDMKQLAMETERLDREFYTYALLYTRTWGGLVYLYSVNELA